MELLQRLDDETVQCCVTSPPYWGLRDYGTATWDGGDPGCQHRGRSKPRQDTCGAKHFAPTRGSQAAKRAYVVSVREVCSCGARRVDHQIGLESSPEEYVSRMVAVFGELRRVLRNDGTLWLNLGDTYVTTNVGAHAQGQTITGKKARSTPRLGLPPGLKSKDLVGVPWRVALALQAAGWWLRSEIIWAKRNCMPESVTDRPTKSHEQVFLLSKRSRYYYNADALREPCLPGSLQRVEPHRSAAGASDRAGLVPRPGAPPNTLRLENACHAAGRNARSVWSIATRPFPEAHFAVMPEDLAEPCVLAGSRPGDLVLDPFAGAGTVGVVALRHGRRFLGLELNAEYVDMARRRIAGPLFAETSL